MQPKMYGKVLTAWKIRNILVQCGSIWNFFLKIKQKPAALNLITLMVLMSGPSRPSEQKCRDRQKYPLKEKDRTNICALSS